MTQINEVQVTFATLKSNALLMYNPSSLADASEFVGLEIVNEQVSFSIALRSGNPISISTSIGVSTGEWFKVKVTRDYDVSIRVHPRINHFLLCTG